MGVITICLKKLSGELSDSNQPIVKLIKLSPSLRLAIYFATL